MSFRHFKDETRQLLFRLRGDDKISDEKAAGMLDAIELYVTTPGATLTLKTAGKRYKKYQPYADELKKLYEEAGIGTVTDMKFYLMGAIAGYKMGEELESDDDEDSNQDGGARRRRRTVRRKQRRGRKQSRRA